MKDLTLIALLLFIGSAYFMKQQYPYDSSKSENNLKMLSSESELKSFYMDTLYRKRIVMCNQCVPLSEHPPIVKLKQYYNADFLFLFCYCFLFYIIARYYQSHSIGIFKSSGFYKFIIACFLITFFADIGEDTCMLNYFSSNFEGYTPWIKYLNFIKTGGFIILFFFLVIRYPKALIEGFNKCISIY